MTSHRDVEGRSKDELGTLIEWSLRESVAGASPSPEVWGRIRTRARRMATWRRRRSQFYSAYRTAMVHLSKAKAFLLAQIVGWMWPHQGRWVEWRFDPSFRRQFFDQYGFFLLRLAF